jgi:Flp pilus assembly protein CpaB
MADEISLAGGGFVGPPDRVDIIGSLPPLHIPRGGMCWRAPDGSHEWIVPKSDSESGLKPLQLYTLIT